MPPLSIGIGDPDAVDQATAIIAGAAVGGAAGVVGSVAGHLLDHWLVTKGRRSDVAERAVSNLSAASMKVLLAVNEWRTWGTGWRRRFYDSLRPRRAERLVVQSLDRLLDHQSELVRAHGELVQHAEAVVVDRASAVLDASADVVCQMTQAITTPAVKEAIDTLGQARLQFLEAARPRGLGRPELFKNIRRE